MALRFVDPDEVPEIKRDNLMDDVKEFLETGWRDGAIDREYSTNGSARATVGRLNAEIRTFGYPIKAYSRGVVVYLTRTDDVEPKDKPKPRRRTTKAADAL